MFQRDYHEHSDEVLRVAFDGDGVLFSDDSEKVFKEKKLEGFCDNERDKEDEPLNQVRMLLRNQHVSTAESQMAQLTLVIFHIHKVHVTQPCYLKGYLKELSSESLLTLEALLLYTM